MSVMANYIVAGMMRVMKVTVTAIMSRKSKTHANMFVTIHSYASVPYSIISHTVENVRYVTKGFGFGVFIV